MKFVSLHACIRKIRPTRPLRRYASGRADAPPRRGRGVCHGVPVGGRAELRAVTTPHAGHPDGALRTLNLAERIADGDACRDARAVAPSYA